jgi:3-hydroxyacyl-[acyl-carrier-protein] dehydratase
MSVIEFDALRAQLPQDYPFVLLDRVLEVVPNQRVVALKNVSANEWVFPGHFPDRAVYPSVLLLESMAQAAILLFKASQGGAGGTFLIVSVRSRFLQPVVPGDQVLFTCTADKMVATGAIVGAEATVAGEPVATATLTFAVGPSVREENGAGGAVD